MQVPDEFPSGSFDLIMVSEVAYYWQREDLKRAMDGLAQRHERGGHLLLVHLTEPVKDYPLTGDEVHTLWTARPEWTVVHSRREPRFRLDVLEKR